MKKLYWTFGPRVDEYIKQLEHVRFDNLTFKDINEHPEEQIRTFCKGCSTILHSGEYCIYLNCKLSLDEAEETLCHEIEHIELVHKGYNYFVQPRMHNVDKIAWRDLCHKISSLFSDLLIRDKLIGKPFEFKLEDFKNYDKLLNAIKHTSKIEFKLYGTI